MIENLRYAAEHLSGGEISDRLREAAAEIEKLMAALTALTVSYEKNYDRGDGDRYSPWEEDAFREAKAIVDEQSTPKEDRPCETCKGDPIVCASVPGLRHCEAAQRD